ncbi:MAG TPA: aldolase/citrate lyase family protein [Acidimicrobiia bacterium]
MSGAESLRLKQVIHGFWSVTGNHAVIDTACSAGPDFIVVDTQHGIDLGRVDASLFTVMAGYGVAGLVRVEAIDLGRIGRALDLGAAGIVVPLVVSADDAAQAVHATRHAPLGGRSYGMQTRRIGPFDEQPYVVIQVETAGALLDIDAIAAVEGVDALYVGPADLGLGLGGSPAPDVNEVWDDVHEHAGPLAAAFTGVIEAADANGIVPGLHCGNGASSARAVAEGFRMTSVAVDLGLIGTGLSEQLEVARGLSA